MGGMLPFPAHADQEHSQQNRGRALGGERAGRVGRVTVIWTGVGGFRNDSFFFLYGNSFSAFGPFHISLTEVRMCQLPSLVCVTEK